MKSILTITIIILFSFESSAAIFDINMSDTPLLVHKCNDFIVNGKGDNNEWQKTEWNEINKINKEGKDYKSKFKILYSATGIYVLFNGEDDKITTDYKNDFDNLFNADVFEVFFHPDTTENIYFEYEVSPMSKELVLLILNRKGKFGGWIPWHYEDKNKTVKNVIINGGKMESGASIKSWSAEIFFPYKIFNPLLNVPPTSGTRWNANFCRLDYDTGKQSMWSWSPATNSFHEFRKYMALKFE